MSKHRLTLMKGHEEFILQPVLNIEETDKFTARLGYFFTFFSLFYVSSFLLSIAFFYFCLIQVFYFFSISIFPFPSNSSQSFSPIRPIYPYPQLLRQSTYLSRFLFRVLFSSSPTSHSSAHLLLLWARLIQYTSSSSISLISSLILFFHSIPSVPTGVFP